MESTLGTIIAALAIMSLAAVSTQVVAFFRSHHK